MHVHAVIDSQKNQDTHLLVPAGDHIHMYGSSKLEAEREITLVLLICYVIILLKKIKIAVYFDLK